MVRTTPLTPNEIHVIAVALDAPDPATHALLPALSAEERARAQRFHFPADRDRFLVGRAVLRGLLAQHTARPPAELKLRDGVRGKPALSPGIDDSLHFNVSHSEGLALIAITRLAEIGIDVEAVHDLPDLLGVAERFFAPAERSAVRALEGDARIEAFFNCWTRKEAYIKAVGEGLAHPLDRFVVTVQPGEDARLLELANDTAAAATWTLADLRPATGFVGALAIRAADPVIRTWRW